MNGTKVARALLQTTEQPQQRESLRGLSEIHLHNRRTTSPKTGSSHDICKRLKRLSINSARVVPMVTAQRDRLCYCNSPSYI